MPPKQSNVFVVYDRNADAEITFAGAYTKETDADSEAKKLTASGKSDVAVEEMSLNANAGKKESGKGKATAASKKGKEKSETPTDDDDDQDEEDEAPAKPKKAAKKTATKDGDDGKAARKTVPEGVDGSCDGLKLLFTGTMSLDRKVMEATAIKYGAEIVNKLEDTDWIVMGTRPGDKKVKEIKEKGLKMMLEEDFMTMIQGGGEPEESAELPEPPKKKVKT